MKKIGLSFIALAFALVIPFSSADASSGWDYVKSSKMTYNSTYGFYDTANASSTGGDLKLIAVDKNKDYRFSVELWEYDPGSGNDDYVGYTYFERVQDHGIFRNIGRFVDGSNHRAEFYAKSYDSDTKSVYIQFWD
ncbi:hypothetical protein [Virgibacillus necropolis]|uniref:DUF2712 domain-containing protein n=1 Tax=Virgibacillus necropolis TaxID=163877 RepID=A0A221MCI4_9BACI|nr:hypothetical protein [Virgibacillus necropolis]ASN05344.1 hypothetical protein CFK40_10135 [Virgibacillus necropolis]